MKECIEEDAYCSPLADRVRHNVGVEFEYRLLETLRNRRLVFESEDVLRCGASWRRLDNLVHFG